MEKWLQTLQKGITDIQTPATRFGLSADELKKAAIDFPFRTTKYYFSLIQEKGDAIFRQCVPDIREREDKYDLLDDPLGEEKNSPVENIVHRYPEHCLFLVSNRCAMHCRFCTRKRKFRTGLCVDKAHIDAGIEYIRKTETIHDVLISGGDPLLLEDEKIEYILQNLRAIKHVEILRIGTRTPCVLPERITVKLVSMLKKYHPLFFSVHFNHPDELTPQSLCALKRLADAGIPLGSQTVLLRGVNDSPGVMRTLMKKLLTARVRPYYLFQCDLVYGSAHFRTPLSTGLKIMDSIRGWTGGLAVPHFAIDLPHGGGKVTLVPAYLQKKEGRFLTFRNYRGDLYTYPDLSGKEE